MSLRVAPSFVTSYVFKIEFGTTTHDRSQYPTAIPYIAQKTIGPPFPPWLVSHKIRTPLAYLIGTLLINVVSCSFTKLLKNIHFVISCRLTFAHGIPNFINVFG